jgi:hypothetical protein
LAGTARGPSGADPEQRSRPGRRPDGRCSGAAGVSGPRSTILSFIALLTVAQAGHGFGVEGHRAAGLVAEAYLCEEAEHTIRDLGDGAGLGQLGLWADRIRASERWAHAEPWHYVNVADGVPIERRRHSERGDVLWAVRHFRARLAERPLSRAERAEALKFFTHFVVDLHQPLHVGRASDRGGNGVQVILADAATSLHRFWDTDVLRLGSSSPEDLGRALLPGTRANALRWSSAMPLDWARESQEFRSLVYDFGMPGEPLTEDYVARARDLVHLRLAQAGVRLAYQLNAVFCPAETGPVDPAR